VALKDSGYTYQGGTMNKHNQPHGRLQWMVVWTVVIFGVLVILAGCGEAATRQPTEPTQPPATEGRAQRDEPEEKSTDKGAS
jgi:hypothetical protein